MDIKLSFRLVNLASFAEFQYNQMIPIPSAGDEVVVGPQVLKVIDRAFVYQDPKAPRLRDSADIEVRFRCEKV